MSSMGKDPVQLIRDSLLSYYLGNSEIMKSLDAHLNVLRSIYQVYSLGIRLENLDKEIQDLKKTIRETGHSKQANAERAIESHLVKLQQELKNKHPTLQTTDTEWLKNLRRELLSTGVNISLTESESVSVLKKDIDAIVREIKGGRQDRDKEADWISMQQKNFPASQLESLRTTYVDDLQKGKTTGHEEENSRLLKKVQAMGIETENLKAENKTLSSKIQEQEMQLHREKSEIGDIKGRSLAMRTNNANHECERLKREVEGLRHLNTKLVGEKNYWITRLSEIAGAKVTEGNPSIKDLSDPNRPIKLAERFGEIYDGPWTDLLEECTKQAKSSEQGNKLEKEAITEMLILLKNISYELRQTMAGLRRLALQTSIETLKQDCINTLMKKRKSTLFNLKPSKPFIESCTEMCWFMTMQQPPMVFYFGGHKKNTQLERDYFQFYTKSGSLLDFVV
ncbi:centrosomal protein of 128 kDa-like isoform X2 [Ostrea edulis]|uniref:centrosomal protein of 128 kDa-like isoform X2 n=1 Tax=Ostrea edulis TaxID=37623 RepID=UPI0024AEB59A|nr:centrosomal protein of 128 kDa-like isoform X2 [Ostrea edulis]